MICRSVSPRLGDKLSKAPHVGHIGQGTGVPGLGGSEQALSISVVTFLPPPGDLESPALDLDLAPRPAPDNARNRSSGQRPSDRTPQGHAGCSWRSACSAST